MGELVTRDAGSITGSNIKKMKQEFGKDPREWSARAYKKFITNTDVPQEQSWIKEHIHDMLEERMELMEDGETKESLELLNFYINTLATI